MIDQQVAKLSSVSLFQVKALIHFVVLDVISNVKFD